MAAPSSAIVRPLSPRQREALTLIGGGWQDKQIARRWGCQRYTVTALVREAMDRLGAPNRTRAVVLAIRTGQLHLDDIPRSGR